MKDPESSPIEFQVVRKVSNLCLEIPRVFRRFRVIQDVRRVFRGSSVVLTEFQVILKSSMIFKENLKMLTGVPTKINVLKGF